MVEDEPLQYRQVPVLGATVGHKGMYETQRYFRDRQGDGGERSAPAGIELGGTEALRGQDAVDADRPGNRPGTRARRLRPQRPNGSPVAIAFPGPTTCCWPGT